MYVCGHQGTEDLSQYKHLFGERALVEAEPKDASEKRVYVDVSELTEAKAGQQIWVRGRVHRSKKPSGGLCFIVLRQQFATVQVVITEGEKVPRPMVNWTSKLKNESIIDIFAAVRKAEQKVEATTQQEVELDALQVYRVSGSDKLPVLVEDCMRPQPILDAQAAEIADIEKEIEAANQAIASAATPEAKQQAEAELEKLKAKKATATKFVEVDQSVRLDNRVIDLRVRNHSLLFLESRANMPFRIFLTRHRPILPSSRSRVLFALCSANTCCL
jgi:aspartyl/asparaginyl-tRNA synthetase